MVGYGYGYITMITIITILTNNRITILKMVKMVIYLGKNDQFFFQKYEKGEISGWNWSEWFYTDLRMTPYWPLGRPGYNHDLSIMVGYDYGYITIIKKHFNHNHNNHSITIFNH